MDGACEAASDRILLEPYKYLLQLPGESFSLSVAAGFGKMWRSCTLLYKYFTAMDTILVFCKFDSLQEEEKTSIMRTFFFGSTGFQRKFPCRVLRKKRSSMTLFFQNGYKNVSKSACPNHNGTLLKSV